MKLKLKLKSKLHNLTEINNYLDNWNITHVPENSVCRINNKLITETNEATNNADSVSIHTESSCFSHSRKYSASLSRCIISCSRSLSSFSRSRSTRLFFTFSNSNWTHKIKQPSNALSGVWHSVWQRLGVWQKRREMVRKLRNLELEKNAKISCKNKATNAVVHSWKSEERKKYVLAMKTQMARHLLRKKSRCEK